MMNWEKLLSYHRPGSKITGEHSIDQIRSAFEKDFDRIIFSHPFRKLQDKTQVFPIPEQDFVHNRLTHSLEVSSVGRSLGKSVGTEVIKKHPNLGERFSPFDFGAITAAASLAHDIGNPPFGHSGEEAISGYFKSEGAKSLFGDSLTAYQWKDLTNFEGNAQGFRILNSDHFDQGLKLTYASMGAFTKYPHGSLLNAKIDGRKSQKKFGYFQSEKDAFNEMIDQLGLPALNEESFTRHPLVFLVEAADDICYHVIDFEDGCRLNLVSFETVKNFFAQILKERFDEKKLAKIGGENEKISVLRALVINQLIGEVSTEFMKYEEEILAGTFDKSLVDCIPSAPILNEISNISIEKLYRAQIVLEKEAGGYEVIERLLESFCTSMYYNYYQIESVTGKTKSVFRLIPGELKRKLDDSEQLYNRLLLITDYISGLTDRHAISLFKTIKGISLPIV